MGSCESQPVNPAVPVANRPSVIAKSGKSATANTSATQHSNTNNNKSPTRAPADQQNQNGKAGAASSRPGDDKASASKGAGASVKSSAAAADATAVVSPSPPTGPISKLTSQILQEHADVYSDYDFDKVMGKGSFGVVRLVTSRKTNEKLACKSISKLKLTTLRDVEEVRREVQIMSHLAGHPNVTNLRTTYEDKNEVHLIMDLCTGGELFDKLSAQKRFSEKEAAEISRTIVSVVHHCHTMNVIHRDLKPENFLFSDKSSSALLKASDFGLSRFFREGECMSEIVGSPYYVAPEVLLRKYNKEADIWSCGVILYILLCGSPPFKGENSKVIFKNIVKAPLDLQSGPWANISDGAKEIVRKMLMRDPKRRLTAEQVLAHPWLKENGVASDAALEPEVLVRMRQFANMNKFKKEACKFIATNLPMTQIMGMKQMFEDIDKDSSGTITVDELRLGLRHKGADLATTEVQRLLDDIDLNGNSIIDYEEFLAATLQLNKANQDEHIMQAFKHFDLDSSGFITRDELLTALCDLDEVHTVVDQLMAEVDINQDGKIDYMEFSLMMQRNEHSVLKPPPPTVSDSLARDLADSSVMGVSSSKRQPNSPGGGYQATNR